MAQFIDASRIIIQSVMYNVKCPKMNIDLHVFNDASFHQNTYKRSYKKKITRFSQVQVALCEGKSHPFESLKEEKLSCLELIK